MNAPRANRVRREFFLPAHVDQIITSRALRGARSKSEVMSDAVLALNALLLGTFEPGALAKGYRDRYGIKETTND